MSHNTAHLLVDLAGKHGRVRTVPMPPWTKAAIDAWSSAAGIASGLVFRGVNKGDAVTGERLSSKGILRAVTRYAEAVAPHDLRRTFAKLAYKGGAKGPSKMLATYRESLRGRRQVASIARCSRRSVEDRWLRTRA